MKSGSHYEQLQSEHKPAGAGGSRASESPERFGLSSASAGGEGTNAHEDSCKSYPLNMDKYGSASSFSHSAGQQQRQNQQPGLGVDNSTASLGPPPPPHGSFVDRPPLPGPGNHNHSSSNSSSSHKSNLLESLFLAASSRLRGSEDDESSNCSTTSSLDHSSSSNNPHSHCSNSGSMQQGDVMAARRLAGHLPMSNASHFDYGGLSSFPPSGMSSGPLMMGHPSSLASGGGGGASSSFQASSGGPLLPSRSSLSSLIDVARKRSYEAAMGGAEPAVMPPSPAWPDPSPPMPPPPSAAAISGGGQLSLVSAAAGMGGGGGGGGRVTEVRVGLLPSIRADDYQAPAKMQSASGRSQREALSSLTAEEKLERRKERARMYSHIARKRQETNMRELKAEVESLTVYRLMVEEAPDMMAVLSPDIDSRFLFANGAFARILHVMPATLLGSSIWTIIHEQDKPEVMKVLGSIIMATHAPGFVRCRVKRSYPDTYVAVDITMRYGRLGIICFLRTQQVPV